jgi:spore maturation protein CgeB
MSADTFRKPGPSIQRTTADKLLYVGMLYDYGDAARGWSFEERNFHHPLKRLSQKNGWDIIRFDFMQLGRRHGVERMSEMLWETVKRERPRYLVSVLFNPEHDPTPDVLQRISFETDTTTLNWFCDDHWRFDNYSRLVAQNFNFAVTTDSKAVEKYRAIGMGDRVIKSQWGCNHELYRPIDCEPGIEVSFVGQPHGNRPQIASMLQTQGIPLRVFGFGWQGAPRLPFHEMVWVFNRSKINLNLSNASVDDTHQQIKGRNFEIPGTGGFLLTGPADNLHEYYVDGKEVVVFQSHEDMADRIRYYLKHDSERKAIAKAGYERTLREHTWEKRWNHVFERLHAEC